jgi:hypothetical protein
MVMVNKMKMKKKKKRTESGPWLVAHYVQIGRFVVGGEELVMRMWCPLLVKRVFFLALLVVAA